MDLIALSFAALQQKKTKEKSWLSKTVKGKLLLMRMGLLEKPSYAPHLSGVKLGCNRDNNGHFTGAQIEGH